MILPVPAFARSRFSIATALLVASTAIATADVPGEYQGKWSSDPVRCEQENGEVDVLNVTRSGFEFYEIGCRLDQPVRSGDAVRFAAQCYKGGSPDSQGTVIMRLIKPDRIELALVDFPWISEKPETFRRCGLDRQAD